MEAGLAKSQCGFVMGNPANVKEPQGPYAGSLAESAVMANDPGHWLIFPKALGRGDP